MCRCPNHCHLNERSVSLTHAKREQIESHIPWRIGVLHANDILFELVWNYSTLKTNQKALPAGYFSSGWEKHAGGNSNECIFIKGCHSLNKIRFQIFYIFIYSISVESDEYTKKSTSQWQFYCQGVHRGLWCEMRSTITQDSVYLRFRMTPG